MEVCRGNLSSLFPLSVYREGKTDEGIRDAGFPLLRE
jgi:hypothetical protein